MNILHIDSSILGDRSVTRRLSAEIVAREVALHPGSKVVYRDLAADPIEPLSAANIGSVRVGAGVAPEADVALSEALIAELFAADIVVIGAPMYNFSVPIQLKAWIDRVAVAGKTFKYGPDGAQGLVPAGKKGFIASARGGVYSGESPYAPYDHQEKQLAGVLGFIGLRDVSVIRVEGVGKGPEAVEAGLTKARADIAAITA